MISCGDFLAELANYMDDGVTAQLRVQLENHLSHCETCQVIVDSTRKTVRIVTESGSFDLPEAAFKSISAQIMAKIRAEIV
jgi:hypothetical protein